MILSELVTAVRLRTGYAISDAEATDAIIQALLKEAVDYVNSIYDWPWQYGTVEKTFSPAGSIVWNLDTEASGNDVTRIHSFTLGGIELRRVTMEDFIENHRDISETSPTGQPLVYAEGASSTAHVFTFYLSPIPTTSLTARIWVTKSDPTALGVGTNPTAWPHQYQYMFVEYASYLLFRQTYQFDKAQVAYQAFQNWLKAVQDNRRRVAGPRKVRVRKWFW